MPQPNSAVRYQRIAANPSSRWASLHWNSLNWPANSKVLVAATLASLLSVACLPLSVFAQGATDGFGNGFGNFGVGSSSGFGSLGGSTAGTGGQTGASGLGTLGGMGGTGTGAAGTGAAGGVGGGIGGMGSLGTLGGSFDPGFGATQMASGLAAAAAVSQATSGLGGRGGFGGGFGGGMGGRGGMGGFGGQNQNGQNNQNQTKIRAVVSIGFPASGPSSQAMTRSVNERFSKMPLPAALSDVQITMQGRTAVLTGEIGAVEDSKLVERLLSLEPGIDAVRNELTIAGQPTTNTRSSGQVNEAEVVPLPSSDR